jgi:SAM-dependent methyltransferase
MTPEEQAALGADGDRYHRVNYEGIGTIADPAFEQMEIINAVSPIKSVLEIGCTTGFRLEKARKAFGAQGSGLDASQFAISEGKELYPDIDIRSGFAPQDLDYWSGSTFDTIVVGHLLYLLPRTSLFLLAAKVDSLLSVGGHLIVIDFIAHIDTVSSYTHQGSLKVFKGDPSAPWSWHPQYFLVHRNVYPLNTKPLTQQEPNQWQSIDVLRKLSVDQAFQGVTPPASVHDSATSTKSS